MDSVFLATSKYKLVCTVCASSLRDDGFLLKCPGLHSPALLKTVYSARRLVCDNTAQGIYRYNCWLPTVNRLMQTGRSTTFQSQCLGPALQLPNLWIVFSGYCPQKGSDLKTGTFKELEAYGVLSRIATTDFRAIVVASAGNTATAFARICSENCIPCLVIVPESCMKRRLFDNCLNSCVKVACLTEHADYSDAIAFAETVSSKNGFFFEGGVKNVGRRDGMATAMLGAVEIMGRLPDYYFQAIGSGAGAIAAHEAAQRLVLDGRFGRTIPRLMLSQNSPFTPVYDTWKRGVREFVEPESEKARSLTRAIVASVLSNRRPAYSVVGGLFDALTESSGDVFAVTNAEALRAKSLFERCEGIDIDPAAAVAVAALSRAAGSGQINREAVILLHVTGGGFSLIPSKNRVAANWPDLAIPLGALGTPAAAEKARGLFLDHDDKQH